MYIRNRPGQVANKVTVARDRVDEEEWTREVATGVAQKLVNWSFLSRRRHTDPTLRAIFRSRKKNCINNTQKRERTIVSSVGMIKYEGMRRSEVVEKETRRDWAQHERRRARQGGKLHASQPSHSSDIGGRGRAQHIRLR